MLESRISHTKEPMPRTSEISEGMQEHIGLLVTDTDAPPDEAVSPEGTSKDVAERRLRSDAASSKEGLRDVQRLLGSISASLSVEDILNSLMNLSRSVIDYRGCGIFLVNEETAVLDTAASRSFSKGFENKVRAQWDEGIIDWVMDAGAPIVVPDLETMMEGTELTEEMSFVISPLSVEGKKVGVLVLYCDRARHTFTEHEIDLVGALSNQAAIAVENAHLYRNLERTHKELQASQAQLVQSAKLAAVGELASGTAHEINNPLQIILGRLALVKMRADGLDEKVGEDLNIIDDNIMRISEIVRRLLDFASRRGEESEMEVVRLNEVVRQVHDLVGHQLDMHRIQFVFEEGRDLPGVEGNATEINEVFLNMILNAQHAMPEGGTLTVSTRVEGGFVEAVLSDTGVGIPEENLERIFEPFFTTRKEEDGTGLGLSVCYGIIRKHGGAIEVDSELNKGATFTIKFPV